MGRMARRVAVAALATALLLGLGACSADDSGPPAKGDPNAGVALQVESVRTPGVDEATRTELESEIGDVLASYIVAGYLGEYPRDDFVRSLADFSNGLADDGGKDLPGLTLAGLDGVTAVRATQLHAELAYFAPGGQVVGARAFLRLAFDVTLSGGTTESVTREGHLELRKDGGAWRVSGYRLCCYDDAVVEAEVTS